MCVYDDTYVYYYIGLRRLSSICNFISPILLLNPFHISLLFILNPPSCEIKMWIKSDKHRNNNKHDYNTTKFIVSRSSSLHIFTFIYFMYRVGKDLSPPPTASTTSVYLKGRKYQYFTEKFSQKTTYFHYMSPFTIFSRV